MEIRKNLIITQNFVENVKMNKTFCNLEHFELKQIVVVKRIIFSCVCCKKLEGKPYQNPPAGDTPSCRLEDELAYTTLGRDFPGPLFIKVSEDQASPKMKAYIALYTINHLIVI